MLATFETKNYIICPHCGKSSGCSVDHLLEEKLPRDFGDWGCKVCHESFEGKISADKTITIEKVFGKSKYLPVMDLLVIPPQDKPIYLLKRGDHSFAPGKVLEDIKDNARYYYEQHSCPTNWMDNFETISIDDDGDPHGLIRYVNSMMPEDFEKIVNQIKAERGHTGGSSDGDCDYTILATAFPEVRKKLDPDFVDDGILDLIGDPVPGKRVVTVSVKHTANEPGGPERYTVALVMEDGTEEKQAAVREGDLAVLIGEHLCLEWRAKLETDEHTKRYVFSSV